jgi:uncharacterized protein (DUF2237 family)
MSYDPDPKPSRARNVLGGPLQSCSNDPLTGFLRDGCCNTGPQDPGLHVICARVTKEFLRFSAEQGNDLTTPHPEFNFAGLKPGDQWCLCAERWRDAFELGAAPGVVLMATHEAALNVVSIDDLKKFAIDLQ